EILQKHATAQSKRYRKDDMRGLFRVAVDDVKQCENNKEDGRDDHTQRPGCTDLILEFTAVFDGRPFRQIGDNFGAHALFDFLDKTAEIASLHVGLDEYAKASVFAGDLVWAFHPPDHCDLSQRDDFSVLR